jgi:hypothetical protein
MTLIKGKEAGVGWVASAIGLGLLLFIAGRIARDVLSESIIRSGEWTIVLFWAVMTTFKHRWHAKKFWRLVVMASVMHSIVLVTMIHALANMSFVTYLGFIVIEGILIVLAIAIGLGAEIFSMKYGNAV